MVEHLAPPRTLLTGLTMVESARWHDGRLWFAHWGAGEVVAVDMDGDSRGHGRRALPSMGWAIDWLPDGRLVTTGPAVSPSGAGRRAGDALRAGRQRDRGRPAGRMYVNGSDFDFVGGGLPEPGWINLVASDGTYRQVAGDIEFPNGMVVTPDGSTWSSPSRSLAG